MKKPIINFHLRITYISSTDGKISATNIAVDYNSTTTVRVYAEVYATDSKNLPENSNTLWVQAPSSSNWWINILHDSSNGIILNAVIKNSSILDLTDNISGFSFSSNPPFNINNGIASIGIITSSDQNKDQKILLHLDIPQYLWYGSRPYSFDTNTNCSQHPCISVDIFGTTDTDWYGSGDKKGYKTIKSTPKGRRIQKMNW
jgi:hypothetical protein